MRAAITNVAKLFIAFTEQKLSIKYCLCDWTSAYKGYDTVFTEEMFIFLRTVITMIIMEVNGRVEVCKGLCLAQGILG